MGLAPVMMFSTVHLEAANAPEAHRRRIAQAAAAKTLFLLTFGKTGRGEYERFVGNLRGMAGDAKAAGVTVVTKQHGGNTATGRDCARIVREVGSEAVRICSDAGNVLDYENQDPKLLRPVMRTGGAMPLACENVFEPLVVRPATAEGVDALARRTREFVETVLRGLASVP